MTASAGVASSGADAPADHIPAAAASSAVEGLAALYDADYYKSHCSDSHEPYERSELWLTQFGNLAEAIIRSLGPRTVLDAGCAWGFLVESLRDRGVEAWGIDVSEYAIANVRPDMRPYCRVGNIVEPISGRYDLVTCIEVLEHLPEEMADPAIRSLCAVTDTVLFSSSPDDFDEPTHFNVNTPIYWLRLFAAVGFVPDIRHDAGYLTPHAVLLRRSDGPIDDAVLVLHARKQLLSNDVNRLKQRVHDQDQAHARDLAQERQRTHEANLAFLEARGEADAAQQTLATRTHQLNLVTAEAEHLRRTVDRVMHSWSWKLTRPMRVAWRAAKATLPLVPYTVGTAGESEASLDARGAHGWLLVRVDGKTADPCVMVVLASVGDTHRAVPLRLVEQSDKTATWVFHSLPDADSYRATLLRGAAGRIEFRRTSSARAWGHLLALRLAAHWKEGWWTLVRHSVARLRDGSFAGRVVDLRTVNNGSDYDYPTWLALHDNQSTATRERVARWLETLADRPMISIIMPTYRSDLATLAAAVESVKAQVYPNWELCIADDASNDPALTAWLTRLAEDEPRVKVCFRETNGHISAASNSALMLASGSFVALMDHDDELHPFALAAVAASINEQPDVDLLFSDEDKIDIEGVRYDPYFKPAWNPDLLLSQNYVSHLGVYRRSLVEEVGGFREGYEGSQDYDLVLRVTERTDRIRHIPHVLYHWRAVEGSTARATSEKDYATVRAHQALEDAVRRRGLDAEVVETGFGAYHRVRYGLPETLPAVSLIVPTKDKADLLETCVRGLLTQTDYPPVEVLIVDNNSAEPATFGLFDRLRQDSRVRVLTYPKPFNYSAINNFAAREATGEILALINNDIEVIEPGWLKEMVSHAVRPGVGVVGARLYYPDDRVQHDGIVIGKGGVAGYAHPFIGREDPGRFGRSRIIQNYSAVTAAAFVVRKAIYDAVEGLDESIPVAFNDVDFCLRVCEAGYRNVYTPFAELYHHESVSRGRDITTDQLERARREVDYMKHRWATWITDDPNYNQNLPFRDDCFLDLDRRACWPWDGGKACR